MSKTLKMLIARTIAPGTPVPPQVALNMVQGYKNVKNYNGTETIYSDFDIRKFRAFFSLFSDATGIRIYNALTATNQHCFLFVPIKNIAAENEPPCYVELEPEGIDIDGDDIPDFYVSAFNFGTLCPPSGNCNCECDGVNGNPTSIAKQVYGNLCP
jgi:hypothetical protein